MQTKALFLDAYRDLNARKLFWIVLILNVLVVAGFAALGVSGNRISIFAWQIPQEIPFAQFVYKWIFTYVIVGQWLTWIATILALISTASIFPDFMAGGAIDLYLSKPIGRLRLFLTKYVAGLLFVPLQVTVFTIGSFFVLGWRGRRLGAGPVPGDPDRAAVLQLSVFDLRPLWRADAVDAGVILPDAGRLVPDLRHQPGGHVLDAGRRSVHETQRGISTAAGRDRCADCATGEELGNGADDRCHNAADLVLADANAE